MHSMSGAFPSRPGRPKLGRSGAESAAQPPHSTPTGARKPAVRCLPARRRRRSAHYSQRHLGLPRVMPAAGWWWAQRQSDQQQAGLTAAAAAAGGGGLLNGRQATAGGGSAIAAAHLWPRVDAVRAAAKAMAARSNTPATQRAHGRAHASRRRSCIHTAMQDLGSDCRSLMIDLSGRQTDSDGRGGGSWPDCTSGACSASRGDAGNPQLAPLQLMSSRGLDNGLGKTGGVLCCCGWTAAAAAAASPALLADHWGRAEPREPAYLTDATTRMNAHAQLYVRDARSPGSRQPPAALPEHRASRAAAAGSSLPKPVRQAADLRIGTALSEIAVGTCRACAVGVRLGWGLVFPAPARAPARAHRPMLRSAAMSLQGGLAPCAQQQPQQPLAALRSPWLCRRRQQQRQQGHQLVVLAVRKEQTGLGRLEAAVPREQVRRRHRPHGPQPRDGALRNRWLRHRECKSRAELHCAMFVEPRNALPALATAHARLRTAADNFHGALCHLSSCSGPSMSCSS